MRLQGATPAIPCCCRLRVRRHNPGHVGPVVVWVLAPRATSPAGLGRVARERLAANVTMGIGDVGMVLCPPSERSSIHMKPRSISAISTWRWPGWSGPGVGAADHLLTPCSVAGVCGEFQPSEVIDLAIVLPSTFRPAALTPGIVFSFSATSRVRSGAVPAGSRIWTTPILGHSAYHLASGLALRRSSNAWSAVVSSAAMISLRTTSASVTGSKTALATSDQGGDGSRHEARQVGIRGPSARFTAASISGGLSFAGARVA